MQRFKTFFHQNRFRDGSEDESVPISNQPSRQVEEDDWSSTIDHRLVEEHRLKWQKPLDWVLYVIAAAFILYTVYQSVES